MPKKVTYWIAGIVAATSFAGGAALWHSRGAINSFVPASVRAHATFVIYVPRQLPEGYTLTRSSLQYKNGFLTYSVASPLGKVVFTQQARPGDFSFDQLSSQSMEDVQHSTTPLGPAATALLQNRMMGFVLANTTLVNVNGPVGMSRESMQLILATLQPATD